MSHEYDLAVIVGRFQVPRLTEGHEDLIDYAAKLAPKLFVVLGSPQEGVQRESDPLPESYRRALIENYSKRKGYDVIIGQIQDIPGSNEAWSALLDQLIGTVARGSRNVVLLGGRDSFLTRYTRRLYKRIEVPSSNQYISGTENRQRAGSGPLLPIGEMGTGAVWFSQNLAPMSFPVVDMVVLSEDEKSVLLIRKLHQGSWQFPGGFVDPKDSSLEEAAYRELSEEVGSLELDGFTYLMSTEIDDIRYRNSKNRILSIVFKTRMIYGNIKAGDDAASAQWWPLRELMNVIHPVHSPIALKLLSIVNPE